MSSSVSAKGRFGEKAEPKVIPQNLGDSLRDGVDVKQFFEELELKPALSAYNEACYHGTSDEAARKIVREQKFIFSPGGLIGGGAYFYEDVPRGDGLEAALAWAAVRHGGNGVLTNAVGVNLKTERLFDAIDQKNATFFNEVEDRLAKALKIRYGEDSAKLRQLNDIVVTKFIGLACPDALMMEAIRARFQVPLAIRQRQVGLVVRKHDCISGIGLWTN
jgi:hypothetical protein